MDEDSRCSEEFEKNENYNEYLTDSLLQKKGPCTSTGGTFSEETVQVLRLYYRRRMTGTGRQHSSNISEAASRAGLSEKQVKVS